MSAITTSKTLTIGSTPSLIQLKAFVIGLPDEAKLHITGYVGSKDPRERDTFYIKASWEEPDGT